MAISNTDGVVVVYRGHKYSLVWRGATKFGFRAHLRFTDGSKDFWIDASKIEAEFAGA